MLESICYKRSTQEESIAMDYSNHITNHEKDKHLTYEDYVVTELRLKDGWKPNSIAKKELDCSANNLYTSVVLGSCSTSLLHRQKKIFR